MREISGRLLHAQEDERRRIARELHDSVGQYIAFLKVALDSLKAERYVMPREVSSRIDQCICAAEQLTKDARTVSYLLYPPMLEELGLKSAIPSYIDGFSARSGVRTTCDISADIDRFPQELELAIFRVIQEGLTNIHRHSGSLSAHVKLFLDQDALVLTIADGGRGVPAKTLDEFRNDLLGTLGVGLHGMKERMRQLGGHLELTSSEEGTTVKATVALANYLRPDRSASLVDQTRSFSLVRLKAAHKKESKENEGVWRQFDARGVISGS
ncbi:MAG TPA: sensor histidine kinase [Terriglobales bacterium]|nr:sensor histidine kinase [Terriglobales bacterium]